MTFTLADLENLKTALLSGSLEVQIGDRKIKYRSQKELLDLIQLVSAQVSGISSDDDNPTMIQPTFSRGES